MLGKNLSILQALPTPMGKALKWVLVYPRYWVCRRACQHGYRTNGGKYSYPVLFVAGMPKSGTTWLEKMLASFTGYHELLIPEATFSELKSGQGHIFDLPDNTFTRMQEMLVLTKMHVHGSVHNARLLKESEIPYVVLVRDPRDVSISHYHYARKTRWHVDHAAVKDLSLEEGIEWFLEMRLHEYVYWMASWQKNRDKEKSLLIRYEDLRADPVKVLKSVLDIFRLKIEEECMETFVARFSIESMRAKSSGSATKSFYRKGQPGEWKEFYTEVQKKKALKIAGSIFRDYGYE